MVFSRFIWTILILVSTIVGTSVLLGIYLQKPDYPVTISVLIVVLILETGLLIYYLIKIRNDLVKLILALRHEDPTLQFSRDGIDPYFSAIHKGFNEIIRDFRLVRLDREVEHRFFEATVNHVQFGLIAFNQIFAVELVNRTFLELFRLKGIEQLDELGNVSKDLPETFRKLTHQKESLKRIQINGRQYHLILLASKFRLKGQEITLISVRDLSRELDRNELEAWQKLMRILRHEILNSITPIKLLSGKLSEILQPEDSLISLTRLTEEEVGEIKTGLDTIHRRSTGLSNFLDAYSNLYRVPELKFKMVKAADLLGRTGLLFRDQLEREGISYTLECPDEEIVIEMDERIIEQVLINLVKNSMEALQDCQNKSIILSCIMRNEERVIGVKDTGPGIPEEQLESIFIPFYSTRKEGSGIGLSFSQHVMRLHNGFIHVVSSVGQGSQFLLVFK